MIIQILLLTLVIELLTITGRMMFGSKRDTLQGKLPIHLSYVGVLFFALLFLHANEGFMIIGSSLILSDVIHHVGLFFMNGDAEFPR